MESIGSFLTVIIMVLVYRHANGKAHYPKWLLVIMFVLSLLPSSIAYWIGSKRNPINKLNNELTRIFESKASSQAQQQQAYQTIDATDLSLDQKQLMWNNFKHALKHDGQAK